MATAKITYPNTIVAMKTTMVVYGESHFSEGEVDRIRNAVVAHNPHVVIHELMYEDEEFYKKALPNAKLVELESEAYSRSASTAERFAIRERVMIANITKIRKLYSAGKYGRIAMVVGDTHLRTITTKELGPPTLYNFLSSLPNMTIYRSPHREID